MTFVKHAGNQLKKWLNTDHQSVGFDRTYLFAQVPGRVVYRSTPDDDYKLMVLRSAEPVALRKRSMVIVNPDLGKFTPYNCESIYEPGESPTVYIHDYDGFYEEMELDWLFRYYFLK
tara:strand:+ start:11315 stop:11665 length:351 start_codon:yes stop_codon:yes gene_type:complete